MWEKKISNKNTRCNGVRLKNVYVSGTLNIQQLRLSRNTKNSFTLIELGPLHKNGLSSLSVTRVTTHSKTRNEWQHTQKGWALQLKKTFTRRSRRIKLGEKRKVRLSLKKIWLIKCFNLLNYLSHFVYG
jgi:hypothetical protein